MARWSNDTLSELAELREFKAQFYEPPWAYLFNSQSPRERAWALMLAFGTPQQPATQEQIDALMVVMHRILDSIPIVEPKETDWKYIAAQLKCCGWLVGDALDKALEDLKPVAASGEKRPAA